MAFGGWQNAGADVTPQQKAVVLARIMASEVDLAKRAGAEYTLAVVYHAEQDQSRRHSIDIATAFAPVQRLKLGGLPFRVERYDWPALKAGFADGSLARVDAVYPAGGFSPADLAEIVDVCRDHRLLTLAHFPEWLKLGLDLGVFTNKGEAKVHVRLAALEKRGIRFADEVKAIAVAVD